MAGETKFIGPLLVGFRDGMKAVVYGEFISNGSNSSSKGEPKSRLVYYVSYGGSSFYQKEVPVYEDSSLDKMVADLAEVISSSKEADIGKIGFSKLSF